MDKTDIVSANDCNGHEVDCECYLRKGIFLPPGVNEEEETNELDERQKS